MMISGKIVKGAGQAGGVFGVNTANLNVESADIEDGVYTALLTVDQTTHESIAFLGHANLLEGAPWHCEVHILDGEYDLYDKLVEVELKEQLREPMKFTSEEQAKEQIDKDIEQARAYFE